MPLLLTLLLLIGCSLVSSYPPLKAFVLVGATGDLAAKYLLEAADNVVLGNEQWQLFLAATSDENVATARLKTAIENLEGASYQLRHLPYVQLASPEHYAALCAQLSAEGAAEAMWYLSVPPAASRSLLETIPEACPGVSSTVALEKPFGSSPADFAALRTVISEAERHGTQVRLVDHYLAKEGVQDLLALLREHREAFGAVKALEVGISESGGVPKARLATYDGVGVLLDMLQSHATALLFAALPGLSLRRPSLVWSGRASLGQAEEFADERPTSKTPTFGAVEFQLGGSSVRLWSGKYLRSRGAYFYVKGSLCWMMLTLNPAVELYADCEGLAPGDFERTHNNSICASFLGDDCSRVSRFRKHEPPSLNAYISVFESLTNQAPLSSVEDVADAWALWEPVLGALGTAQPPKYFTDAFSTSIPHVRQQPLPKVETREEL